MMIITIAIPIFIMWRTPEFLGFGAFLISTILLSLCCINMFQ